MTEGPNARLVVAVDANTAVARVAYRTNEICAIFPITPASPMAELADEWSADGVKNIWGTVPAVQEMQSEGGAAGTLHGALQSGALTTTFTASQGLLLMLPNMFKIAGELTAAVFHVAARTVATHALSIFGDHSDVMAARGTGFALLSSACVQEAQDFALIAQAATLEGRVPFLHFFDGFRTSHEVNTIEQLTDSEIRAMIRDEWLWAHRRRALDPEHPFVRGTAHNPDTFFQASEASNPYYARLPEIVSSAMERFAQITGRRYSLVEYSGDPAAERVVVAMGSANETLRQTAEYLRGRGERVGVLTVHLYRPFPAEALVAALPSSCTAVAVLDRTKEAGSCGEPLYLDVIAALAQAVSSGRRDAMPRVIGGRYGLASKEFDPAMARAVFDELKRESPKPRFTVGIEDDVSNLSLTYDESFDLESSNAVRAVFYGLGSDGTVGANKESVKMIAEDAGFFAQAYFVYDAHKSGARTISHLRFGKEPIRAPYLIKSATFVGCHKLEFLFRIDVLACAAPGGTFLLNSPYAAEQTWDHLPRTVQEQIIAKGLRFYVIDASRIAREVGLGGRTNTILQTCFFALSGVLPLPDAVDRIKRSIRGRYARQGENILAANYAAVDRASGELHRVVVPDRATGTIDLTQLVPETAPEFARSVTAKLLAGLGDRVPVSAMPVDGTYPSGTAAFEKRNISDQVAVWDPDSCIQCGLCSFVCPHSVIRAKFYDASVLTDAPASFKSAPANARGFPDVRFSLAFSVEDCTGCGWCVEVCPVQNPLVPARKAVNLEEKATLVAENRKALAFFEGLPVSDRARVDFANVRGVQFLEPTFEFSGACEGCGETPYLKVLSQLFGDRLQIANATGCTSIYGANLPVTPWTANSEGRGPAWSNSLFEDNAEFGLGFRLAIDKHRELAEVLLGEVATRLSDGLAKEILAARQIEESEIRAQRLRVARLKAELLPLDDPRARHLLSVADLLIKRSIWIIGGDGWAYDIGYGGLDHVLATERDVNILVLDTEVYSNTGGQASKATPLGAIAQFASAGKRVPRKDLALEAISYGNVYVAQVAMGANPQQTLLAMREAEAYSGPSLILAYSTCIAHGIEMRYGLRQQDLAVASGYWPLFRFNPAMRAAAENPFRLDSPRPTIGFKDFAYNEARYKALTLSRPAEAEALAASAQEAILEKYRQYEALNTDPALAQTAAPERRVFRDVN
jgi:pyruvate-ferredoxin/flavodoxin oxidoreductase